jgi:hypothetical protein
MVCGQRRWMLSFSSDQRRQTDIMLWKDSRAERCQKAGAWLKDVRENKRESQQMVAAADFLSLALRSSGSIQEKKTLKNPSSHMTATSCQPQSRPCHASTRLFTTSSRNHLPRRHKNRFQSPNDASAIKAQGGNSSTQPQTHWCSHHSLKIHDLIIWMSSNVVGEGLLTGAFQKQLRVHQSSTQALCE